MEPHPDLKHRAPGTSSGRGRGVPSVRLWRLVSAVCTCLRLAFALDVHSSARLAGQGVKATLASGASSGMHILALGDSLTEGMTHHGLGFHPYTIKLQQLLDEAGIAAQVHNSGISGERVTPSMMERLPQELQLAELEGFKFSWVLILGGTNDVGYRMGAESILHGLQAMYATCKQHGARVLAMTIMEAVFQVGPMLQVHDKVNNELTALAGAPGYEHVTVFDLEQALPYHALTSSRRRDLWDDGLHLTPEGYDYMGELIFKELQPLLKQSQSAAPP